MSDDTVRLFGAVVILSGVLVVGLEGRVRTGAPAVMAQTAGQADTGAAAESGAAAGFDARDNSRMDLRQSDGGMNPAGAAHNAGSMGMAQPMPREYDSQRDMTRFDNRHDGSFSPSAPPSQTEPRR